jgi:hypothetical protein
MYKSKASLLMVCLGFFVFEAMFLSGASRLGQSAGAGPATAIAGKNQGAPKKLEFDATSMGEMRDKDGVHLGFTNFKASDGSSLRVLYEGFGSPAKAKDYFERKLVKAVKVIERTNKLNAAGKVVGERAEILISLAPQRTTPAVMWTDGETFHEICSSSRESILELEKVYKY